MGFCQPAALPAASRTSIRLSPRQQLSYPYASPFAHHVTVKRHPHAERDQVHVWMLDYFVRVGKSVGNSEMLGRFACGFLAARADRRDLELRKRAQGRDVGIAPPAVAYTCSN